MQKSDINEPFTGDPSHVVQSFPKFDLQILCCRYWWLKNWEHSKLSFPFWRVYYNFQEGASIEFNHQVYELKPDCIYLIAPNTDYSTRLYQNEIPKQGHTLVGGSLSNMEPSKRDKLFNEGAVGHIFIHFVLNNPYITTRPGIFEFPADERTINEINKIRDYLLIDNAHFDVNIFFTIHSLACSLLGRLNLDRWKQATLDSRIMKIMGYIDTHLDESLSNESLAQLACITTNSFARLFREEMGITLQNYIRQKRVDKACSLFLHSNLTIDQVAMRTGFSNRYHFSRVFHEVTDTTPAKYKKTFML